MRKIKFLAFPFALLFLASCAFDHSNPFDPDKTLTAPNKIVFAYADNIGSIGPTSIELKWDRSTEADFYFYVVARSNAAMKLTNVVLSVDQKSKIIKELSAVPASVLATWNAATIKSNAPTFYQVFNPVAIIADANSSSYKDTGLTKSTKYFYSILSFKKNILSFSSSADFSVETTPDIASARTCDLLFNFRDAPGEAYEVDYDEVNKKIYVSGYSYGVAYYWNDIYSGTYSTNIDYYLATLDGEKAFDDSIQGYIWEDSIILQSQSPYAGSSFSLMKGFAVNTAGGTYVPELGYSAGWGLYKMTNTRFYDPTYSDVQLSYTGVGIDDFTTHLHLDRANNVVYLVGSTIKLINATSTAAAIRAVSISVKVRLNGVTLDSSGNIFVSDSYSNVVYKFAKTGGTGGLPNFGAATLFVGGIGSKLGQFQNIFDVACDANNNLYVCDTGNQRIQKFDSSGNFLTSINVKELGGDSLASPRGLKYYNNKLYVACSKALLEIPL
jgi:hypothetical protein